jgi:hypothetical protein
LWRATTSLHGFARAHALNTAANISSTRTHPINSLARSLAHSRIRHLPHRIPSLIHCHHSRSYLLIPFPPLPLPTPTSLVSSSRQLTFCWTTARHQNALFSLRPSQSKVRFSRCRQRTPTCALRPQWCTNRGLGNLILNACKAKNKANQNIKKKQKKKNSNATR